MAFRDTEYEEEEVVEAGRKGGATAAARPYAAVAGPASATTVGEGIYLGLSRTAWPAIWAGFFISAMCYLLLSVFGVGIGLSWYAGRGELGMGAGFWFIFTGFVSFFVGGVVTGRMAAVPGKNTGALNGLLFGCFSILLLMALMATPIVQGLPSLAAAFATMGGTLANGTGAVTVTAGAAIAAAWWTFVALIIALAAAAVGGAIGARGTYVDPLETTGE